MLGLKLYEWLTLGGVIVGPIVAVSITLWIEARRGQMEKRSNIARTLMATRHLPADVAYNGAINLIPIEFNGCQPVMDAWRAYIDAVRFMPDAANVDAQNRLVEAKQSDMLFKVLRQCGYRLSESDIQTSAYASKGFIDRDNLLMTALASWPRIAAALETQVTALGEIQPQPVATPPARKVAKPR